MAANRREHDRMDMGRRAFLRGAVGALPLAYATAVRGDERPLSVSPAFPGLIVRQHRPDNLEFPFPTLDSFLTPNDRFYVRTHFEVPRLEPRTWRLRVEGAVERPLELTYDEVRNLPARTIAAVLECSGNSRVFLVPRAAGIPWELGAVGNAEWTGVQLGAILERAGVRPGAVDVILEGADAGEIRAHPNPFQTPGRVHFARSVPLAKARRDVLLAYRMNGADLPSSHGYPVRAIVPGWYGMASTKWLSRIIVSDRPFQGFFQTIEYAYFVRRHGLPTLTPVTELQVKALIARPALNEVIPAGRAYRVYGAAWTGETEIERVDISTDGGQSWTAARLVDRSAPNAWRLWEYSWMVAGAGRYTLMARARDRRGNIQPATRDPDRRNAMINHLLPVTVHAR